MFILDVEVPLKLSVFSLMGTGEALLWLWYRVAASTEWVFVLWGLTELRAKSRVSQIIIIKKKIMLFTPPWRQEGNNILAYHHVGKKISNEISLLSQEQLEACLRSVFQDQMIWAALNIHFIAFFILYMVTLYKV